MTKENRKTLEDVLASIDGLRTTLRRIAAEESRLEIASSKGILRRTEGNLALHIAASRMTHAIKLIREAIAISDELEDGKGEPQDKQMDSTMRILEMMQEEKT